MTALVNAAIAGSVVAVSPIATESTTAVMVNGDTIFTAVGDVEILGLYSKCVTANNATASTLQYAITATGLNQVTISGASASLANAAAGTVVSLDGTALSTAPSVTADATALAQVSRGIFFPAGALKVVIGVGSTTGTWKHYLLYRPRSAGAYVV